MTLVESSQSKITPGRESLSKYKNFRMSNFQNVTKEFFISGTGQVFSKRIKITPQIHISKFEKNGLRTCVLLGVISDIHRALWVSANPVDVKNDHQEVTCPQDMFFKFADVNLGSDFYLFSENQTCKRFLYLMQRRIDR